MKFKCLIFPTAFVIAVTAATAHAAVGFVNTTFPNGFSWFGNPLQGSPDNHLSSIMPTVPDGTSVSLWSSTLDQYVSASTFDSSAGGWSLNLTLNPGTGALLQNPDLSFVNTFVGVVLGFDGQSGGNLTEPPPFVGLAGLYLLSSKAPVALSGHVFDPSQGEYSVFESIIGRAPQPGEQVTSLNPNTEVFTTTTFAGGVWNNGDPSLPVGGAAMFNLGPVPEPSAMGLLGLGLGALGLARRRFRR